MIFHSQLGVMLRRVFDELSLAPDPGSKKKHEKTEMPVIRSKATLTIRYGVGMKGEMAWKYLPLDLPFKTSPRRTGK